MIFKRNIIKIPAKKNFILGQKMKLKIISSFIYIAKNYLSLEVNDKYFIFF